MQAAKAAIAVDRRFGCCPFRIAWWAKSFPLAACSIAALLFDLAQPGSITGGIAVTLLGFATLVIAAVTDGPCRVRVAHDPIPSSISMANLPRAVPSVIGTVCLSDHVQCEAARIERRRKLPGLGQARRLGKYFAVMRAPFAG